METVNSCVNEAADEALTNAMYRYTFGIVGDGERGREGRGIGTGVGVLWNGTFLILTAAHTMQTTPNERLSFYLPQDAIVFRESRIYSQTPKSNIRKRVQLERPEFVLDDERDLAAFVLPEQTDEDAKGHFYLLDESHTAPEIAVQVGFVGYPEATRLPMGSAFVATPYSSFGDRVALQRNGVPVSQMAVSYSIANSVDPHGLSGAGLWISRTPEGALWTARISLVGLVTDFDPKHQVLLGYTVEELLDFIAGNLSAKQ